MCSFDWLKRLACLPPTSPSQSTTMTTVPNTTSLTTTKPQHQVAAATTTHTQVNQGTAIQTPAKRRYSEQHHFQLSCLMKEKIKSSIASVGAQKLGAHFGLQNVKASAFYHLNDQFKRRQNLFREFHLLLSLLPCPKAP